MTEQQRHTADTITDDALDALYDRAAVYRAAWHSARQRARVLSDELTRRAPLLGEYATAWSEAVAVVERVRSLHAKYEDSEHCQHDGEPWPCPTLAALDEAQEQRP